MPITASVLYNLVICPQRVGLDAFGDPAARDAPNAFVKLLWDRGTLFERETIGKLEQPFLDLSEATDEDKENLTLQAMRRGEPLIYSGRISADDLLDVPDLLGRKPVAIFPATSSQVLAKREAEMTWMVSPSFTMPFSLRSMSTFLND